MANKEKKSKRHTSGKRKEVVTYNEDDIKEMIQENEKEKTRKPRAKRSTENRQRSISRHDPIDVDIYQQNSEHQQELSEHNIIEIVTVQCSPFKWLMDTLNGILTNVNIKFTSSGIKARDFNDPKTIFINLEMSAKNFEHYRCTREEFSIGIKLNKFYKYIKNIGAQNVLTLFVDERNLNKLGIIIEDKDRGLVVTHKVNLLDPNDEGATEIKNPYTTIVKMPSTFFQKICRDCNPLVDILEIRRTSGQNKRLIFLSDDEDETEIILGETKDYLSFIKNDKEDEIIQGFYSLKDLTSFTKCANISKIVKLYLDNNKPLMIEYDVGNLGTIQLSIPSISKK